MTQPPSFSAAQAGGETSFLSLQDALHSPDLAMLNDSYAAKPFSASAGSSHFDQPGSPEPDYTETASGSRRASPSKASRFLRSRPGSSKDLSAAALADAGHAPIPSESLRTSPTRTSAKQAVSRGSRLGALLGRTLPGTDSTHARNASSSTNHTEGASSNDSGFFGRRARSKPLSPNDDGESSPDPNAAASSHSTAALAPANTRQDAARSASALGMLDFRPDPTSADGNSSTSMSWATNGKLTRPSSQSNLLDSFTTSSARDLIVDAPASSSATAAQPPRGGRLGRLAYKKDDPIAFIAQSRNASQRMATGTRSSSLQANEYAHQQPHESSSSSPSGATRGLGIDGAAGPYASTSYANHSGETGRDAGLPSSRVGSLHTASSSNASSRAPSMTGSHAASYHNRFSRQGLSQELAVDPTQQSEPRATRPSTDARATAPESSRNSYERSSSSPRGTLSDAAIAALGAMPGASAGSLLNANGAPLSSKNILTIALQKAQSAVQLDSANNVPDAIAAYKQAVRLLEEVMERIAPRSGKRSRPSREEERRRLRVIHDTYADRIRLLSMIYSPDPNIEEPTSPDTSFSSIRQPTTTRADWLDRVRDDSQEDPAAVTPRMDQDQLHAHMQRSPRDDSTSFLSMTPGAAAFIAPSPQPDVEPAASGGSQHPFPKSPPMPNASLSPVSPAVNTSPRRRLREHARPGSRESHRSRASVSLSIADEQEAQQYRLPPPVIAEEMPRISVDASVPPSTDAKRSSSPSKRQSLRDKVAQVREEDALAQQHGRSDSDSSYRSSTTTSRLKPGSTLQHRVFGLDDEVRTPTTPYFDASGDVVGVSNEHASNAAKPSDPPIRERNSSMTLVPRPPPPPESAAAERPAEKPAKLNFAQRARALSFKGPLLRQKASMPSLGDRKRDDAADNAAVPAMPTRRPGSADSTTLEPQTDHPTPWDLETSSNVTVRPGTNRPRASTSSALVSASTSAGTISQRRKHGQAGDGAVQGLSDQLEELGLMMEEADTKSAATMIRQRSTSQPGSRRPSIPFAFVSANANASGGVLPGTLGASSNGDFVPPPVPDLARTLSALELKRSVDTQAVAKAGGADASFATSNVGDVSIPTFALPLPRRLLLDDASAEDKRDGTTTKEFLITDIFPSGLPSLAAGAPSYASASGRVAPPLSASVPAPAHSLLKPFCIMDQLRLSITSGAQITERLYLSRAVWRQAGVKLVSVETKVRAIEVLLGGLETVEKVGEALLMPLGSGAGLETSNASRFVKCLDEWESIMVEVQGNLCKKLPFLEAASVKEVVGSGKSKFASGLGSRFTRGLDRMTGGAGQAKTMDSSSIGAYVDALVRLFGKVGVLGLHLKWLLVADGLIGVPFSPIGSTMGGNGSVPTSAKSGTFTSGKPTSYPGGGISSTGDTPLASPTTAVGTAHTDRTAYSALPSNLRATLQTKLGRSSDFMAKVVLAWVLQDVGVLVERGVGGKRGGSGVFE